MISYFVLYFFVLFLAFFLKKATGRNCVFILFIILLVFYSIRNYTVGTDTLNYVSHYLYNYNPYQYGFNEDVEIGYQYLDYLVIKFTNDYFWLFIVCGFITIYSYLYVINRYSNNFIFSLFIYLLFGFYTFAFNGLRQGLAIAICFFALPYLLSKNKLKYFSLIILASLFHISSLIMLFIYFLIYLKFKLEYKVLLTFILSLLGSNYLINYLAEENSRYEGYTQPSEVAGGYIVFLFYFILGIFVYFFGSKERHQSNNYQKIEQIYLCGIFLVLPIVLLGTNPSGPQRILNYFTPMLIFLIPYLLDKIKSNFIIYIFILLSIIYCYLNTSRFGNLVPYILNPAFEVF